MFDYHLHTAISFDSQENPENVIRAAETAGLKEICFTDHYDLHGTPNGVHYAFTPEEYKMAYEGLSSDKLKIRYGAEIGLTLWNKQTAEGFISKLPYDFILGSIHYVGEYDPYYREYWEGISFKTAVNRYLEETVKCVSLHDDFDVLGHLTYVFKSDYNSEHLTSPYSEVAEAADEIMRILVDKGKGMEINTSGVDKVGEFLPSFEYLKRFRELGGEIVTIGSDAHDSKRVGQYTFDAAEVAKAIFGYVCTFEQRKPIFHTL